MILGTLPRTLRTVGHLRASQLWWRCRYYAARRWLAARAENPPPAIGARLQGEGSTRSLPAIPPSHRPGPVGHEAVDLLSRGRFRHLHRTVDIGRERPDWRLGRCAADRLWTVTLHYHGWAYDLAEAAAAGTPRSAEAAALLEHYVADWIRRCDVAVDGARELAWNSFAIATRIGWWIRTYLLMSEAPEVRRPALEEMMRASLWRQAAYLERHIEWDLRGNHLLRDLVGLAWAGRFFEGARARGWIETASRLAVEQVAEQVLPDGVHFERSPTYHIQVMEDVLSLALLVEDAPTAARMREACSAMAGSLRWLRHPDGQIPLFNDAGLDAACDPNRMLALAATVGCSVDPAAPRGGERFPRAGLVVWHGDPWTVFFNVGPIGPDVQPGHGHADTLTFECSFAGLRLFVDPGTHSYDLDERRRYDRSTAAHNTVCIDESDSSEVWHIFRVGRRARPRDVNAVFRDGSMDATAAHDGFRHLRGKPLHRRRLQASDGGDLIVTDTIEGRGVHRVRAGLLVDPGWSVEPGGAGWLLRRDGRRLEVRVASEAELDLSIERKPYHPRYGVEVSTHRVEWSYHGELPIEARIDVTRC